MQIDYVKISCKEDVHICHTNFAKKMEWNLHETTSQWKIYGKQLFFEDFEVRDVLSKRRVKVDPCEWGSLGFNSSWWRLIPWCVGGGLEVVDRMRRWAVSS
jgi:hypothetical protein